MKFRDEFTVALQAPDAWALLTDLRRIGPCIPGAHLGAIVDGEYRGRVTTQIGSTSVSYKGIARFAERDDVAHRVVIEVRGRDERGSGAVRATISAELAQTDQSTRVRLGTDLFLSGTAAHFGRAQLAEFGTALVAEFAARLDAAIRTDLEPVAASHISGLSSAPDPATAAAKPADPPAGAHATPVPSVPVRAAQMGADPGPRTPASMIRVHGPQIQRAVNPDHGPARVFRKLAIPVAAATAAGLLGWLAGRRARDRT
jgi:uncharacterized protein